MKQPGLFLELDSWTNWATDGEEPCLDWWPRSWWSLWAPWSYVEMGETTEGQTPLQHSTDLSFMLLWPNSILSSVKTHENTLGIYKKAPKGPSDCEKQYSLVWWTSITSIMFEVNQLCSSAAEYHPSSKVCCISSCCGAVSQRQGLIRVEEKLNAPKYWDSLNENPVQSVQNLRLAEGSPSNRTMTLNTQQEWLIDNSVNICEWPSHSLRLNPI